MDWQVFGYPLKLSSVALATIFPNFLQPELHSTNIFSLSNCLSWAVFTEKILLLSLLLLLLLLLYLGQYICLNIKKIVSIQIDWLIDWI